MTEPTLAKMIEVLTDLGKGTTISFRTGKIFLGTRDPSSPEGFTYLAEQLIRLEQENNFLRALASKIMPCHYCGSPSMGQCPHGFPGCALNDDIVCWFTGLDPEFLDKRVQELKNAGAKESSDTGGAGSDESRADEQDPLEAGLRELEGSELREEVHDRREGASSGSEPVREEPSGSDSGLQSDAGGDQSDRWVHFNRER